MKFFFGPLTDTKDNPMRIAVWTVIAIIMIFWGNYFLEMIMNAFSYPYAALLNVDSTTGVVGLSNGSEGSTFSGVAGALGTLALGVGYLLITLIAIIILGYETLKMMLEVVERYLMVGVLAFTSPLAFASLCSLSTRSIFSKWFSMFLGQLLLMLLNAWALRAFLSLLHNMSSSGSILLSIIVGVAFCKVIQRFDSYLQQVGINAAHTGGSILDDLIAAGGAIRNTVGNTMRGFGSGSSAKTLGEAIGKGGATGALAYAASGRNKSSIAQNAASNINKNSDGTVNKAAAKADSKAIGNLMKNGVATNAAQDMVQDMKDFNKGIELDENGNFAGFKEGEDGDKARAAAMGQNLENFDKYYNTNGKMLDSGVLNQARNAAIADTNAARKATTGKDPNSYNNKADALKKGYGIQKDGSVGYANATARKIGAVDGSPLQQDVALSEMKHNLNNGDRKTQMDEADSIMGTAGKIHNSEIAASVANQKFSDASRNMSGLDDDGTMQEAFKSSGTNANWDDFNKMISNEPNISDENGSAYSLQDAYAGDGVAAFAYQDNNTGEKFETSFVDEDAYNNMSNDDQSYYYPITGADGKQYYMKTKKSDGTNENFNNPANTETSTSEGSSKGTPNKANNSAGVRTQQGTFVQNGSGVKMETMPNIPSGGGRTPSNVTPTETKQPVNGTSVSKPTNMPSGANTNTPTAAPKTANRSSGNATSGRTVNTNNNSPSGSKVVTQSPPMQQGTVVRGGSGTKVEPTQTKENSNNIATSPGSSSAASIATDTPTIRHVETPVEPHASGDASTPANDPAPITETGSKPAVNVPPVTSMPNIQPPTDNASNNSATPGTSGQRTNSTMSASSQPRNTSTQSANNNNNNFGSDPGKTGKNKRK